MVHPSGPTRKLGKSAQDTKECVLGLFPHTHLVSLGIENEESCVKIDVTTIHGLKHRTDHHETLSSLEPNRHDQDSEETRQAKWANVSIPCHLSPFKCPHLCWSYSASTSFPDFVGSNDFFTPKLGKLLCAAIIEKLTTIIPQPDDYCKSNTEEEEEKVTNFPVLCSLPCLHERCLATDPSYLWSCLLRAVLDQGSKEEHDVLPHVSPPNRCPNCQCP